MSPPPTRTPPAWLLWWEELHVGMQVALLLPVASLVLWFIHIVFLNQPVLRGLTYGIFWGVVATGLIVGASRSERARRGR